MKIFVTGASGFVGSTLADAFLKAGHKVVGYDNLSSGIPEFLNDANKNQNFEFVKGDILDSGNIKAAMSGIDCVAHLSANADVRFGTNHPDRDLQQNTIGTFNVLEAMRANNVKRIAFSSTGSVYGECPVVPTKEDAPFPTQTSLYGASKLAGEGLISAYAEGFGIQGITFRFVSILGPRYTHGHVFDFYKQLRANPSQLRVLGDGLQRKSYLHVEDCVEAIQTAVSKFDGKYGVFNLGTDEYCQVKDSIGWICAELAINPELLYSGGARGWIGDNPFIFLDCTKMRQLGWTPKHSISESIKSTLHWLRDNAWVLDRRS